MATMKLVCDADKWIDDVDLVVVVGTDSGGSIAIMWVVDLQWWCGGDEGSGESDGNNGSSKDGNGGGVNTDNEPTNHETYQTLKNTGEINCPKQTMYKGLLERIDDLNILPLLFYFLLL